MLLPMQHQPQLILPQANNSDLPGPFLFHDLPPLSGAPATMSNAVKIFILVNLVFSLVLAVTTMRDYATRENWKRRWDQDTRELLKDVQSRDQLVANESKNRVRAEALVVDNGRTITDLQNSVKKLEADLNNRDQEILNFRADIKKAEVNYNSLNESYMTQQKSLDLVRARNAELTHIAQVSRAVAFNLNVKLSEVEDDLNNAQSELTQRAQEIDALTKESSKGKAMLALLQKRNPQLYNELVDEKASTKALNGVVAAVREGADGKQDTVMLSIGKDEKVEEGIEFILYRGGDYVVKVRAEKVMADMVSCRIIADSWNNKNLKVQQGDLATNRL